MPLVRNSLHFNKIVDGRVQLLLNQASPSLVHHISADISSNSEQFYLLVPLILLNLYSCVTNLAKIFRLKELFELFVVYIKPYPILS